MVCFLIYSSEQTCLNKCGYFNSKEFIKILQWRTKMNMWIFELKANVIEESVENNFTHAILLLLIEATVCSQILLVIHSMLWQQVQHKYYLLWGFLKCILG